LVMRLEVGASSIDRSDWFGWSKAARERCTPNELALASDLA
jgi:hypothetical protein